MNINTRIQSIVFAAGCFWGVEKYYNNMSGVIKTTSGYAGGNYDNPTYDKILQQRSASKNIINYTEAVEVVYDESLVSTLKLVKSFWELHNPTQGDRQGTDIGNNYRSAIYYTNNRQKNIALNTKIIYQILLNKAGYGEITTEIKTLEKFYRAEEYHQNYLKKNPYGYCPDHSTEVKFEENFYKTLGELKLGKNSEAFNVAFNQHTDKRFSKKYEKFQNSGDGLFIDKISGDILFDTRDRFNSGSGWLSFFKAIDGAVIEKEDNSFGMKRIEVIAKESGIHLGHLFNDAPGGGQRFCINATVLEFVERKSSLK